MGNKWVETKKSKKKKKRKKNKTKQNKTKKAEESSFDIIKCKLEQ